MTGSLAAMQRWRLWVKKRHKLLRLPAAKGTAECVASFAKFHMLHPVPGVVRSCFLRATRTSIAGEVTE
jgi:hypothetical protein